MARMRAVQVARAGGRLELIERDMPEPARGEVRVRVEACGVCHSDSLTVEGQWPDLSFPRIPGHEVAGVIDAIGAGVVGWRVGQRVGVGWFGGHCGHCEPCRRGWLIDCRNLRIPGISYDGGYAEAMVAPAHALAAIPDEFGAPEAAPLLCAGVTTFNALRHSGAMPGVVGHASGASIDSQDTLAFSALSGVRPMVETMPLARAPEAYARMMRGDARFRMVLTMT